MFLFACKTTCSTQVVRFLQTILCVLKRCVAMLPTTEYTTPNTVNIMFDARIIRCLLCIFYLSIAKCVRRCKNNRKTNFYVSITRFVCIIMQCCNMFRVYAFECLHTALYLFHKICIIKIAFFSLRSFPRPSMLPPFGRLLPSAPSSCHSRCACAVAFCPLCTVSRPVCPMCWCLLTANAIQYTLTVSDDHR